MIDKSKSVNWTNVWWILGVDHLTFEGVIADFRKKYPADGFRGEKACKDITGKNNILHWRNIAHAVYNAETEILHCCMSGKKILTPEITHTPSPPLKSHMVNHIGGGGEGGLGHLS